MERRHIFLFLYFILSCTAVYPQVVPNLFASVNEGTMNHWVDSVFDSMSEEERIGQLFMIVAEPVAETRNITKLINLIHNLKIGGILFQRGSPESQITVTNRLQREARIPLLIALDGEWGLSMRLNNTTRFPKNMMIGAISDLKLIEQYGEEVGRQCREMGIHVNFAPDVDVNSNPENPVIGIRSFGEDPEDVAQKAIAYARGLENAGIISVAKHFPGHGDTDSDSHHLLPVINHDMERLENVELYPFGKYIESGLSGIMVAHLDIPALGTNGRPSSFSGGVVAGLLRDRLGFRGLCFTDGLAMKGAVTGRNESMAVQALKAGNDILLGPVNPEKEFEAVRQAVRKKQLDMSELDERCRRILRYKYIAGLNHVKTVTAKSLQERLNLPHAEWLNARLNAEAVTIVKNRENILPVKQLDRKRIAAVALGGLTDNEFHRTLKKYDDIDCFSIPNNAGYSDRANLFGKLDGYDFIICSVHNATQGDHAELQKLASGKDVVFVFFTVPYRCAQFRNSIEKAQAVVIAYEPTPMAENYAAQILFGGVPAKGSLPVGVPDLFPLGVGIKTEKTRLGFHEPEEVRINPYKLQAIDSIVQGGLDGEAYPGCRVLVAKDGMIIYDRAFGHYDYTREQPVTEETVYDLASLSKAAGTLLALMKSYDEENFQLSDKISKYVAGLDGSDKKNIVIRDMLYHQSGLPPTIPFYEQAIDNSSFRGSLYSRSRDGQHPVQFDARTYVNTSFGYNPKIVSDKQREGFHAEVARNFFISDAFVRDSILAGIKNARKSAPGRYVYSCINFILLKMMIEQQTGEPMDKFLRQHFFDRLGASSTTYNPLHIMNLSCVAPTENDRFIRRQTVHGYVHDEAAAFQGGVSGNAGLFSSAVDLAKIMQLYLNNGTYGGERYLSEKTCHLFTGSKSPVSRRGLGFDKPDAKNPSRSPCGRLAPQAVYGHTGYTGTCFWIDPANNMFFIFLSNRTYPSRTNTKLFSLDIRPHIQDAIYKSMEPAGKVQAQR